MPIVPNTISKALTHSAVAANGSLLHNATIDALDVVCAWPISGQYGPGTRVLYYVLVAACVLARKMPWLRNACLAAALLIPAVAGIHGIVLAAVHVTGAVDLDVFGAFQICSIAILTAPPTVRLSETYWNQVQGRNAIFLWTGLILSGLLSLSVEFYRSSSTPCKGTNTTTIFPYGEDNICGLTCSTSDGPFSPLRHGANDEIFVIPSPTRLTFGMCMLISLGCSVPAVVGLLSIWNKIVDRAKERRQQRGMREKPPQDAQQQERDALQRVNVGIKKMLSAVEIPLYTAAVIAIVVLGEINFASPQLQYQTEPMASVGQWTPIAGTVIAVTATLVMYMADPEEHGPWSTQRRSSDVRLNEETSARHVEHLPTINADDQSLESEEHDPGITRPQLAHTSHAPLSPRTASPSSNSDPDAAREGSASADDHMLDKPGGQKDAGRSKIAKLLKRAVGGSEDDRFQREFWQAKKKLPLIPGEKERNPDLSRQQHSFRTTREADDISIRTASMYGGGRSRRSSVSSDLTDILGSLGGPVASPATPASPGLPTSPTSPSSPSASSLPPTLLGRRYTAASGGAEMADSEMRTRPRQSRPRNISLPVVPSEGAALQRLDTLQVPRISHHRSRAETDEVPGRSK